ncbi:hypothetical protein ASE00_16600 [Sphingomonas sp. Root710]|nr:hypothetical protein ASE00_16600 [Sphingomonas sp. Root710]
MAPRSAGSRRAYSGRRSGFRLFVLGALLSGVASPGFAAAAQQSRDPIAFNIPAQDMEGALLAFAKVANVQLAVNAAKLRGMTAPAVVGRFTPSQALVALLRASQLHYTWIGTSTLAVEPQPLMKRVSQRLEPGEGGMAAIDEPLPVSGGANDADGEILVTARRSAERLIDVPVAVSALSRDTLIRNNITSLARVAEIVPFVTLQPVPAGAGGLFAIRGIGSPPADPGIQQSVLVNIDNVMIGRGRAAQAGLFDLAQIEVLKGPQALFFGKNAPAGVISVTTADPGPELAGFVRGGYEFVADERYIEGAIGGPVTDNFGVRVAARYSNMEGYLHNSAQPGAFPCVAPGACGAFAPWIDAGATIPGADYKRLPHGTDWGARITAIWSPTSRLTAKFKYAYGDNQVASYYDPFCSRGLAHPSALGFVDLQSDCKLDSKMASSAFPALLTADMRGANGGVPYTDVKTHVASLNIDWDITDYLSLSSISGYYKLDSANSFVLNVGAIPAFYLVAFENSKGLSQEVRVSSKFEGPINFVVGGFVDRIRQFNDNAVTFGRHAADPANGRFYTFDRFARFIAKSWSGFGQLRVGLSSDLELAGGVRYTHETRTSLDGNTYVNPNGPATLKAPGVLFDRSLSNSNWSPEATLTWHPTSNQTLYGAFKTGYKSGGFSYPLFLTNVYTATNTAFKPEKSKGFEVGYKAQLLDRRLVLQAAAYTTDFDDQQVSAFDQATLSYLVGNAAKARVKGVEVQATMAAFQGMQLRGSIGYNDARYVSYPAGPCPAGFTVVQCPGPGKSVDLGGHRLTRAPKWQGNAGFTYTVPVGGGFETEFTGDAFYSSGYFLNDNLDPFSVQKSYWKLNAGVSVGPENGPWKLALIGRNLTNEYVARYANDIAGGAPGNHAGAPERPREIVIEGRYSF